MNPIHRPDVKLIDLLKTKSFTISAEVIPPRNGSPQDQIFSQVAKLIESGAEFLSVTKGAGGSLRGGSLPIALAIKDHFKAPAIAHFTCRDLTPEEIENQLMDHHYFGIRNILGLRGDPPNGQPNWTPNDKSYPYAKQLIRQIRDLNHGRFIERPGFQSKVSTQTDFCIGAAAYPDAPTESERIQYFLEKIEAGAEYGITQMIYDPDSYSRFLEDLSKHKSNCPILPGARILRNKAQSLRMQSKFGIHVPKTYHESLPDGEDDALAISAFLKLVDRFKRAGAPGIHLFVLSDTQVGCQVLESLRSTVQ